MGFLIPIDRHKIRLMVHMSTSTTGIFPNEENHLRILGGCALDPMHSYRQEGGTSKGHDNKTNLYTYTGLKIR